MPGQIDVVFCSDQTADSWIVKEVATIKQEGKVPHVSCTTPDLFTGSLHHQAPTRHAGCFKTHILAYSNIVGSFIPSGSGIRTGALASTCMHNQRTCVVTVSWFGVPLSVQLPFDMQYTGRQILAAPSTSGH